MVDRTDKFGDIVEEEFEGQASKKLVFSSSKEDESYSINVKPFGQPLLLIFLNDRWEVMKRLGALPKVLYCKKERLENLINHCYHIVTYVSVDEIIPFAGRLGNISQSVVAIDLLGKDIKSLNIPFKLDFGNKSDDFIYEYLKEMLKVE